MWRLYRVRYCVEIIWTLQAVTWILLRYVGPQRDVHKQRGERQRHVVFGPHRDVSVACRKEAEKRKHDIRGYPLRKPNVASLRRRTTSHEPRPCLRRADRRGEGEGYGIGIGGGGGGGSIVCLTRLYSLQWHHPLGDQFAVVIVHDTKPQESQLRDHQLKEQMQTLLTLRSPKTRAASDAYRSSVRTLHTPPPPPPPPDRQPTDRATGLWSAPPRGQGLTVETWLHTSGGADPFELELLFLVDRVHPVARRHFGLVLLPDRVRREAVQVHLHVRADLLVRQILAWNHLRRDGGVNVYWPEMSWEGGRGDGEGEGGGWGGKGWFSLAT